MLNTLHVVLSKDYCPSNSNTLCFYTLWILSYGNKCTLDAVYVASLITKMHFKNYTRKIKISNAFCKSRMYFLSPF